MCMTEKHFKGFLSFRIVEANKIVFILVSDKKPSVFFVGESALVLGLLW